MCALRSLLLTVISLLISTRIDFATALNYDCHLTKPYFTVGSVNQTNRADFYDSLITITVPDYGHTILTYPGSNTISFSVGGVTVKFNGTVVYYGKGNKPLPRQRIVQGFQDRIVGIAQRFQINNTDSDISDCHLYLLPMVVDRLSVSSKIASEMRRLAESCIEYYICLDIGKLGTQFKVDQRNLSGLVQLPGLIGPMVYHGSFSGPRPFQNALNTLVDRGLAHLTRGISATGRSTINLPKIDTTFVTAGLIFNKKGHFEAMHGTLSDLSALVRTTPPTISHEGMKFIISSKFAINSVKLSYAYKLYHNYKTANGRMVATMKPLKLEATFIADYTKIPCITTLDEIKVTSFGKITRSFTGAGKLKSLLGSQNWFTKEALRGIGSSIKEQLRYAMNSGNTGLWSFNCEIYRP